MNKLHLKSLRSLKPSNLTIGCAFLQSPKETYQILTTAIKLGVTDFDTAPLYQHGKMEEYLGHAIKQLSPTEQSSLRIFTKCGRLLNENGTITNDYTADGTLTSLQSSIDRLGIAPYGLRIHDPNDSMDRPSHIDEVGVALGQHGMAKMLKEIQQQGIIQSIGIGMNTNVETTDNTTSKLASLPPSLTDGVPAEVERMIDGMVPNINEALLAGGFTLLTQVGIESMLKCQKNKVNVAAAGIFSTGLLVGKTQYAYQQAPTELIDRANKWEILAKEFGFTLPEVAIAFVNLPVCVTRVVVGVATVEELVDNIRAAERSGDVPTELWREAEHRRLIEVGIV